LTEVKSFLLSLGNFIGNLLQHQDFNDAIYEINQLFYTLFYQEEGKEKNVKEALYKHWKKSLDHFEELPVESIASDFMDFISQIKSVYFDEKFGEEVF